MNQSTSPARTTETTLQSRRLRRRGDAFRLLSCAVVLSFSQTAAQAEVAAGDEMEHVCHNWLSTTLHEQGAWAGEANPKIVDVQDIVVDGDLLGRCYSIAPDGFVVVPALKALPPVKAYSQRGRIDVNDAGGIAQLVRDVLADRARLYRWRYGSLEAPQPESGDVLLDRVNRRRWDRFTVAPEVFGNTIEGKSAVSFGEAGPLLTSQWHQGEPYNNFCPMGDGGRTVVGCVATAASQLMNYHQWPPNGVGDHTYYWIGDYSCGASSPYPGPGGCSG